MPDKITCQNPNCPVDVPLMGYRLTAVETAVAQIADAVKQIAASTNQLARLEERHAETREGLDRAFSEIREMKATARADRADNEAAGKSIDDRVKIIELRMPGLIEMRGFLVKGVIWIVGLVGVALVGLVVISK